MAITKVSPDLLDLDAGITISVADNSDNLTLTSTDADANVGPNLKMYRNSSSPADSDVIAAIDFDGRNDNSQDVQYAQIIGQVYDVSDGTEDAALYLQTMVGGTTRERITLKPTESVFNEAGIDLDFRVESDANANMLFVDGGNDRVGIGTASPTRTVDINHASTAPDLRLGCDGNDAPMIILDADVSSSGDVISHIVWRWNNTDTALISGYAGADTTNKDDGGLKFSTRTSGSALAERMRIGSAGGVDVGSTSGASAGGVSAYVADNDSAFYANGSNGRVNIKIHTEATGGKIWYIRTGGTAHFGSGGGDLIVLDEEGNAITTWDYSASTFNGDLNDTSDVALKENITDITDATTKIKALKPRNFDWKESNKGNGVDGFIAQEVETVLPNNVVGENYDSDNPEHGSKAINTSGLLAVAVKAIQELEARITTLEG